MQMGDAVGAGNVARIASRGRDTAIQRLADLGEDKTTVGSRNRCVERQHRISIFCCTG